MAEPALLPGNRFRIYRGSGASATFICLADAVSLTRTNEYEDATVGDCDDPLAIPTRRSFKRSKSWGGRYAGSIAADHLAEFEEDADSDEAVPYEFRVDRPAAGGGGKWVGNVHVENLEYGKPNRSGVVTFTVQFRGDGPLTWVPAT